MGYTHYWWKTREIDPETWLKIVSDFLKVEAQIRKLGIKLAGSDGEGDPVYNSEEVIFNGAKNCGHPKNPEIVIPWPTEDAWGISSSSNAKAGHWFAGTLVNARTCNGDCSYESFYFPRVEPEVSYRLLPKYIWNSKIYYAEFCKTAYRPYDIAVNAFLIIAKHYLKDDLIVKSDGHLNHWSEAMNLCQEVLGYGLDFRLDEDKKIEPYDEKKEEVPDFIKQMSYDEEIKLIRKALKRLCPTLSVRRGRGTAYDWVKIGGSKEFGEFTEEEKQALLCFGLTPGFNCVPISPENRDFYAWKAFKMLH